MKKYIFPIFLFIISITLFYFVNKKISISEYNKLESDQDLVYLIKGTKTILYEALSNEELNWGKDDDSSNSKLYLKYSKYNFDEIANYIKQREEDIFSIKASLLLDDLYELYNLKDLIGTNQEEYKKKLNKLEIKSEKHMNELEKVLK